MSTGAQLEGKSFWGQNSGEGRGDLKNLGSVSTVRDD